MRHRNNIGTLRLSAAMVVSISHAYVLSHPGTSDPITDSFKAAMPLDRGLSGQAVAIFFVLSGYLVTQSFLRRGSTVAFVRARLLRIFPALIVVVGVTVVVGMLVSSFAPPAFLRSQVTLDYAVYTATLTDVGETLPGVFLGNPSSSVNISLWTLPLELGMYAGVALVGLFGVLRRKAAFNAVALGLCALYLLGDGRLPIVNGQHPSELALYFVAGAALFANRDHLPVDGRIATAALITLTATAFTSAVAANLVVIGSLAYLVIWVGLSPAVALPDLSARGDLSYGTYLYACPVSQLLILALGPSAPGLIAVLTVAAVLPVAWLSWKVIEAPALRLKARSLVPPVRELRATPGSLRAE